VKSFCHKTILPTAFIEKQKPPVEAQKKRRVALDRCKI
jgi:hypothetical protein